ncbi:MAG: oligosaccharide flippase family protein [Gammaproteobacteria bacterium]
MSRSATILRNIASNWTGFAVNAAVTVVLTPFVLGQLGEARYGVWMFTSSIIGSYGLLDLGFRAGVTQYLTRYLALSDYAKANESVSSAVMALSALGTLMAVLSIGMAYFAPRVLDFPLGMEHEAFWCILIVGFSSAVQCAFFPFTAIFTAMQRFDLANLIGVGTRLLMAGTVYAALRMGYGLVGISAATCGVSLIDYLIRWRVAYRIAPGLEISSRRVNLARLRDMGSFGVWNFLISLTSFVSVNVPMLLIGALMPVAAVAHYGLAATLWRQIGNILAPVGQVIYPAATELHVRGDRGLLERLYRDGTRLMLLAAISLVLVASVWAEDFYRLWIGEQYVSGSPFPSVALLLQILLVSTVAGYAASIAGQILLGAGLVRELALVQIGGAGLTLTLSLSLIGSYGLVGIAVSPVIAIVLALSIGIPLVLHRTLGLHVKGFLIACVRPLAVGALLAIVMVCIRLTGQPGDWFHLIVHGIWAGVSVVAVVLAVGLTAEERQRFVLQPTRRLLRMKGPAAEVTTR